MTIKTEHGKFECRDLTFKDRRALHRLEVQAIDKDGNKLFTLEDKLALMHKVDSDVLSRIATAMVQAIHPEQVKKN